MKLQFVLHHQRYQYLIDILLTNNYIIKFEFKIQVSGRRGVFYAQSAIMPPVPDIGNYYTIALLFSNENNLNDFYSNSSIVHQNSRSIINLYIL